MTNKAERMAQGRERYLEKLANGEVQKTPMETNPVKRFWNNPTQGRAIKAFCSHCVGCTREEIEPGFKETIRDCASTDCPLWMFRPYQAKEKAA